MCYNINYLTRKKEEYARRMQGQIDIKHFDKNWDYLKSRTDAVYFDNGFNFPDVPVITNKEKQTIQLLTWGLIPFWVKDPEQAENLRKRTLNARGEDIFTKPSFRNAARRKRCLVMIDGFFEYHWKEDSSYPFYIKMKNNEPMFLGGLWETWHLEKEGIHRDTFSIVTTGANSMMRYIHNQPKGSKESRMPLIIPKGLEHVWLKDIEDKSDEKQVCELIGPFDENELEAYTVPQLRGKNGVGNSPEAIQQKSYRAFK